MGAEAGIEKRGDARFFLARPHAAAQRQVSQRFSLSHSHPHTCTHRPCAPRLSSPGRSTNRCESGGEREAGERRRATPPSSSLPNLPLSSFRNHPPSTHPLPHRPAATRSPSPRTPPSCKARSTPCCGSGGPPWTGRPVWNGAPGGGGGVKAGGEEGRGRGRRPGRLERSGAGVPSPLLSLSPPPPPQRDRLFAPGTHPAGRPAGT